MSDPTWLNPALDRAALAETFARTGRISIENVFLPELAREIHACLARETPWGLVYNEGEKVVLLDNGQLRTLGREEIGRRQHQVLRQAAEGRYAFFYQTYPILDHYLKGTNPGFFLNRVLEWVNSSEGLGLVRDVTGIPELVKADGQATLYAPGQFLLRHNDGHKDEHWRVAYVMNFTPDWNPDWGGHLQFLREDGGLEQVWAPRFNALNLFRVPVWHSVSYVAPYATAGRYGITGWFRDA
ncbi:MAG TPA: 2OG-Fe(II) oxygenase family protein [Azospirillaceae bacterium]|nr:2OG-Fe(II) oxygenase family protein [Azospirillaceae bacterium]